MVEPPGGSYSGGAGGAAGPSNAQGGERVFDSSGWNVVFGSGTVESARTDAGSYVPYVIMAVAGVVGLIVWRRFGK